MTGAVVPLARRRLGTHIALPCSSVLILVLGWGALWLYGRHEVARIMDAWIGKEEARGRSWACPHREITGFPLRLRIACTGATFKGKLGSDTVEASLSGLQAEALVYQPNMVQVSSAGPLTLQTEGGAPVTLGWSALDVNIRSLAANRFRVSLTMERPELDTSDGASRADRLDFRVGPTAGRPMDENAYDVWLTLDNGQVPALDALTRDQDPLAIREKGVLTRIDPTRAGSSQELVEAWREAGGRLTISTLNMMKGGLHVDARGDLGLDDKHRIAGRLQTALSGYETLMAQLGVPLPAVSVGGVLAHLLSRNGPAPAPDLPSNGGVNLPVVFAEGRMLIGPFKTGWRVPPLY